MVQLWCHAIILIAEVVLEGVSSIRGRCSAIGRNAISSDLQVHPTSCMLFSLFSQLNLRRVIGWSWV